MIALNGWQVPGYETKVNCGLKLPNEDLSGAGSYLINVDLGVKAAVLTVTTKVPMVDQEQLEELITLSKQLDENGARSVFTVNSGIAKAFKIRKVKFFTEVKAIEMEEVKGWKVTFKLLEVLSKSEREQQQLDSSATHTIKPQAVDGHNNVQQQFEQTGSP